MKGCIIINAQLNTEEYMYEPLRLQEEFKNLNVPVDIVRNDAFLWHVGQNSEIISNIIKYDFCIFLDKDKHTLKALEKLNIKLFNNYNAIVNCDDKVMTALILANNNIPMPITISAPLCFGNNNIDDNCIKSLENTLSFPFIIKSNCGSQGTSVWLINNKYEFIKKEEELKLTSHLYQQYIKSSFGKDLRVIVIGDKVVGGMLRQSNNDFRSNIASGGTGKPHNVPEDLQKLSIKIARLLELDYCGIDYLFGEDKMLVCEVNSNAFFINFEKINKINVAKTYAEYILSKL